MDFASSGHESGVRQSLLSLAQESFQILLGTITFGLWMWSAGVMLFDSQNTVYAWLIFGVVLISAALSYALHRRHWHSAVAIFIAGLIVSVLILVALSKDVSVSYLFLSVVLILAVLADRKAVLIVALLCAGLNLLVSEWAGLSIADALRPSFFTLFAAATAWLGSQRLYTALSWALDMTQEAQRNAREAQAHRAEVQRMLKSLDEAYVRLERAHEALIHAREAAERAYRFKAEFVANVSHELRTPLNLIIGFSEMMATAPESYDGVPLPGQYRGDIMAIYQNARHLSDLINDVLDLSRIEAGRMPLVKEAADLNEVVREAADMVRGLVSARRLRLELELDPSLPILRFDRTRIRQVLLNLLTNATRFTERGWVRVRTRLNGSIVEVAVQDSGRGISPEALSRAFESFVRLDENYTREGSGLGLAVSKKFVELHGGRMWIESNVGLGTMVSFSLPAIEEPAISVFGMRTPLPVRHRLPLVLVLHDDPSLLRLFKRYLEGYEFILAETRERARVLVQELAPAVVIADNSSNGCSTDLTNELALPSHVPVIACPLPSLRRLALILGALDYLTKPASREDLLRALSRLRAAPRIALIVDDDPHVVRLLTRMLRSIAPSIRLLKAFTCSEGVQIARSAHPDVIFLDLLMPGDSGYVFMKTLTCDTELAGIPVIIFSVKGFDEEAEEIPAQFHLARGTALSLTEMLGLLRGILTGVTQGAGEGNRSQDDHLASEHF